MKEETKKQIEGIVTTLSTNLDKNDQVIKVDVLALQPYKQFIGEDGLQELCNRLREERILKGVRGGSLDSKDCKSLRNLYETNFIKEGIKQGLLMKDDEYYQDTKKVRYIVLNVNDDRVLPSLNMSNIDAKEREKERKAKLEAKIIKK